MTKLVEMNAAVPFRAQMADPGTEQVVLVNVFHVPPDEVDGFVTGWTASARLLRSKPGFVSTKLHRGIAGSTTFLNYAVWESTAAYREAMGAPDVRAALQADAGGATASPHLFRTVAIEGV